MNKRGCCKMIVEYYLLLQHPFEIQKWDIKKGVGIDELSRT